MEYTPQNYSWLELVFSHWRWVRKLSKGYWVKVNEPGYSWVKFDKSEFRKMVFKPDFAMTIEDYTQGAGNDPK